MLASYLRRGIAAGLLAGLLAGLFAFIFGEPTVDRAIQLEEAAAADQHEEEVAGGHSHEGEEEVFSRSTQKVGLFFATGLLLGYLGFWGVPQFLDKFVPYDKAAFGGTMFLFVFWIFVNVHHYFLDNVMWRRENPDTRKYLFS